MGKSALITGASGFVGLHLTENLRQHGYHVVCQVRDTAAFLRAVGARSDTSRDASGITAVAADFTAPETLVTLFETAEFDAIVHLAGMSSPPECEQHPDRAMAINAEGTRGLLAAAADRGWKGTFLLASSAQVYERAPASAMPLTEGSAVGPNNAYSRSKLEAEQIAVGFANDSMRILIARPFNHVGPGQSSRFAIPGFLQKIQAARQAGRTEFTVGDLSASKDFTDVRDVVEAYRILLESSGRHTDTVFNICSGEAVSMREVVQIAQEVAGANDFTCHSDPGPRAGDPLFMQGRAEPLVKLGWRRRIPLRQSIADTYADLIRTGGEAA